MAKEIEPEASMAALFGSQVRRLRLTAGLTQAQLGARTHVVSTRITQVARRASKLLAAAGLHGHKYALDAIVTATALASPSPVTVLTSAPEDLLMLCGSHARVVRV
ncbi:hypothetical protein ACWGI0_33050 [Streptomyces sp. NPDC054802]